MTGYYFYKLLCGVKIMATEMEARKLRVGDKVKWFSDSDEKAEVIESIIFDNQEDLKNRYGDRVTINGSHWGFANITIVEQCDTCKKLRKNHSETE